MTSSRRPFAALAAHLGAAATAILAFGIATGVATGRLGAGSAVAQAPVTTTTKPQATTTTPTSRPTSTTSPRATTSTVRRSPRTSVTSTTTSTAVPSITAVTVPPGSTIPPSTVTVQTAARPGEGHVSVWFPALSGAGLVAALGILAGSWLRSRPR